MAGYLSEALKPEGDPFAGMSPVDAMKIRAELASRQQVSPEQASANHWTTVKDALSVMPIIGQAMSAYDAGHGAGEAYDAFSQGDVKKGALATALTALSGVGAVTGLPFGRVAGNVAKEAPRTMNAFLADADGKLLPFYHGTKERFSQFDIKKAGKSDPGVVGKAVYFTPNETQARNFAESPHYGTGQNPNVIAANLDMNNPLEIVDGVLPDGRQLSDLHPGGLTKQSAASINRELIKQGYDGVVFKNDGEIVQVAVFSPNQIKRITEGPE